MDIQVVEGEFMMVALGDSAILFPVGSHVTQIQDGDWK